MIEHIFVYGTLRYGHGANYMLNECEHIGTFTYEGAEMFSLGSFPGIHLTEDKQSIIVGDLYKLGGDNTLDRLDSYEGYLRHNPESSLYLRKEIEINGIPTYIYEYNGKPRTNSTISSGDWGKVSSVHRW